MQFLVVAAVVAQAEIPLPSYREQLVQQAWYESNQLLEAGLPEEAAHKAEAFQREVTPDGRLEYLIALSWRLRGDLDKAEQHYRNALDLDPGLDEAWSDLGELLLISGRLDDAEQAYKHLSRLVVDGPYGWLAPMRLGEVAAHRRDPEAFERHMHEALRRGFQFRTIEGLPNWQAFYRDPVMHDSVEKLVTVYGDGATLESLKRAPETVSP